MVAEKMRNAGGARLANWTVADYRRSLAPLNEAARSSDGEEKPAHRSPRNGLGYGNHPAARSGEPRLLEGRERPRLAAIRQTPDAQVAKDPIIGRAKVPSWDEIMFGTSKPNDDNTDF